MNISVAVVIACFVGFFGSTYLALRGGRGAVKDLEGHSDQLEASARQSRQDIASMVWVLTLTNALLAGILAVLVYPHLSLQ